MASIYNAAKEALANGDLDLAAADLRLLILDAAGTYAFDADDDFVADLDPGTNELDTDGYERLELANVSVVRNDDEDRAEVSFDDPSWDALGPATGPYPEAAAVVIFVQATDDNDSMLVGHWPVTGTADGSSVTISVPASGAVWIT